MRKNTHEYDLLLNCSSPEALRRAMDKANQMIESWSVEDLKQFAFDRLTNELLVEDSYED